MDTSFHPMEISYLQIRICVIWVTYIESYRHILSIKRRILWPVWHKLFSHQLRCQNLPIVSFNSSAFLSRYRVKIRFTISSKIVLYFYLVLITSKYDQTKYHKLKLKKIFICLFWVRHYWRNGSWYESIIRQDWKYKRLCIRIIEYQVSKCNNMWILRHVV